MANEPGGDRGGEVGGTGAATGGKGGPVGGGTGAGGASGGTGAQGGAGKPVGISPDVLPESLRGKNEAEIKFVLGQTESAIKKANQENQMLKQQLAELQSKATQKPEPVEEGKSIEDLIHEDPEAAIDAVIRKKYGSTISNLQKQTGEAAFHAVKSDSRFSDFGEYEETIRTMLEDAGAPATRENILGAYTMVVGQKALEEREAQQREKVTGIESGGGAPPEEDTTPKIEGLEREVMLASGFTDEKEWIEYKNPANVADRIRVPTGQRKENNDG